MRWRVGQAIAHGSAFSANMGGKSGLHGTERQVMPGGCEATESAAERKPPVH